MKTSFVVSLQQTSFKALATGKFDGNLRLLKDLGYDGVELAVADPSEIDQQKIFQLIDDRGLEVPAIGTGQAYLRDGLSIIDSGERAIERIKSHIEFARLFDAVVIIGLIRGKINENKKNAENTFVDCVQKCADYAPEIKFAIEPLNRYETDFLNTIEETTNILKLIDARNVGILMDTFHMNIEEVSITRTIESSSLPFHVHIADSNRRAPGFGHLNFDELFSTLKKVGYDRFVSAEILPLPSIEKAAEQTIKMLKTICDVY